MRDDNIGLFWHDIVKVKGPRKGPPPKRTPPPRTWEGPDYLPGLEEAKRFPVNVWTVDELKQAAKAKDILKCDIEVYKNYFLVAFLSYNTGSVFYLEMADVGSRINRELLLWILNNFLIVTFNGRMFDIPVLSCALAGLDCLELKQVSDAIIQGDERSYMVLKAWKVKEIEINHIDLIEVCPLQASLKIYGGRLHTPRMQELPFHPNTHLTDDQITIVRYYCINDLATTAFVFSNLEEQLELRSKMSISYGVDLRSRSDAQVAESVIVSEITNLNGSKPTRPEIPAGTSFTYRVPNFIQFRTPQLCEALRVVADAKFVVGESGAIDKPQTIEDLDIVIGEAGYTIGIGGLHSCETRVTYKADETTSIYDRDVSSYYPAIILNQQLFPGHLGRNFLSVYKRIVDRRLAAKKSGDKALAEFLKIVVNGSFGKFGSMWSALYAPHLLIQVTMTGQLSLLMLIERLELAGIKVASANTDGIVIITKKEQNETYQQIVKQWEKDINFETEESSYTSYYAKDVNNYIALKSDGSAKSKGAYANPWYNPTNDAKISVMRFHKNPVSTICIEAAIAYLRDHTPLSKTVEACRDVTKFVTVRTVKGGAVQGDRYLGKALRWYYTTEKMPEMVYAESGNKVPNSDGAKPMMDLLDEPPVDLDWDYYTREAGRILQDIGRWPLPPKAPRLTQAQMRAAARLLPSPAPCAGGVWL